MSSSLEATTESKTKVTPKDPKASTEIMATEFNATVDNSMTNLNRKVALSDLEEPTNNPTPKGETFSPKPVSQKVVPSG